MKRVHIHVSGLVQGVYFRQNTLAKARELSLQGFVRNLPDGRVEIVCEGSREAIDNMIAWSRKGSKSARVEHLDIQWEEFQDEFKDFRIAY
jgi:acylphosphatase